MYAINLGVIAPFCALLKAKDTQVVQVVLDGISNMLKQCTETEELERVTGLIEECGAVDDIEELQNHPNEEIYKLAYDIIDRYFSQETIEVEHNVEGGAGESGYQFDPNAKIPTEGFKF